MAKKTGTSMGIECTKESVKEFWRRSNRASARQRNLHKQAAIGKSTMAGKIVVVKPLAHQDQIT